MHKNLLWLPIDVPKFPVASFNITPSIDWHFWTYAKLTLESRSSYEQSCFKQDIVEQFPEIVEWFKHLPYTSIRNIKFNLQKKAVKSHIDFTNPVAEPLLYKNNQENEPCGYRILLKGKRENTLYVELNGKKIYTTLPDSTDVYVLRHSDGAHGVEEDHGRETIFTHFEIDSNRHHAIIERSLQKYGKYAIYS